MRPVTALFADIVGSTSLGERLGPDEVKALIGECVSRMARSVEEFGGVVQAYMGDGICALFGVPAAHEDDPERAARAALRIIDVAREYAHDIEGAWGIPNFNVRVGINSGQTAVGLVGGADPQIAALGDTTNVAARLESAATPGTIAIGETTARRLEHSFALEPMGDLTVKGRAGAVPAWRLTGSKKAAPKSSQGPLVGRDHERSRLQAAVADLVAGRGQILLITGEAGMGKTRMLAELRVLAGDVPVWLEGRCPSYGGELLAWPFVEMLRDWLGLADGEAEVAARMKLRARLGALLGDATNDALPWLGHLLAVKLDPEAEAIVRGASPEEAAAGIRRAFVSWIDHLARATPVVVVIDDAQWFDEATEYLAGQLLEITDRASLLVAIALRADAGSAGSRIRLKVLGEFAHRATELPLGPIMPDAAMELIHALAPDLDPTLAKGITLKAEGNPLYLEELLQWASASAGRDRDRSWTIAVSGQQIMPPALEGLLVARVDRLPDDVRHVAQVAAVIGRTFSVRVLERVAGEDTSVQLGALLRAGIVRETRRVPDFECTFAHGMLQEAVLSTLPPARQREMYGLVAAASEEIFADQIEERLDLLSYYWYRSTDQSKALDYLERAAAKAASLGAGTQAEELLGRAAKVAERLGDTAAIERIRSRMTTL